MLEGSGYAISGKSQFQIFVIETGEFTLNSVTLNYGYNGWGGAISNEGIVHIYDSLFSDNFADAQGGAVYNEGELYISNSKFVDNYAGYGGAIENFGILHIEATTFATNAAEYGGGAIDDDYAAELTISDSTFVSNSAGWGGAILGGGALRISSSELLE